MEEDKRATYQNEFVAHLEESGAWPRDIDEWQGADDDIPIPTAE